METLQETINVRANRLNNQIFGKQQQQQTRNNVLCKEGLLDAFQVLYDECNDEHLKKQDKNIQNFVNKYKRSVNELERLRVNATDFEIKGVIGRGHFGEVHLVKEKQTGDLYAMKTIKKCIKNVAFEEERNIMATARSQWLTSLKYAFQDEICLYFVMDYQPGGDLFGLLLREGGTIPESAAIFYLGEILLALNDLHEMGFVHRDLKPDNVLLDRCGHIKLADFGSAAKLNENGFVSYGFPVGTPDYVAPEVLCSFEQQKEKQKYGISCDYWSLGVLAYELTIGNPPFQAQTTTALYAKITNYEKHLKFPSDLVLSQAYISLIKHLIIDEKQRYNYKQIIQHSLFKSFDLQTFKDQIPPYIPKITAEDDLSNFSEIRPKKSEPNMENFISNKRKTSQFSGKNLPFIGFTFTRDNTEDYSSSFTRNLKIKDETVQELKKELQQLRKKMLKYDQIIIEKTDLEKKLDEKSLRLQSIESVRDKLERDLSKSLNECLTLKKTLDIERKDRIEVENKVLDLLKSAKQKWEIAERTRNETLLLELQEKQEKITQLTNSNQTLNEQLKSVLHDEQKTIKKLNRQSVIGLENRLDQITTESNKLQACLTQERKEKQVFINEYKQKLAEKEFQLEKLEQVLKKTENDLFDAHKKIEEDGIVIFNYKQQLDQLECQLKIVTGKDNKKVEELEEKIAKQKQQFYILQQEKEQLNQEIIKQNQQIHDLITQRNINEKQLEETQIKEENNRIKVETLEQILSQLQNGIAKLENNCESIVLKEQIQHLEKQLIELHESNAITKQELAQLKTKHWRIEKELENAEIDKRIMQRECKDYEKQINLLNVELENLKGLNTKKDDIVKEMMEEINILKERLKILEETSITMDCLKQDLSEKIKYVQELENALKLIKNEKNQLELDYKNMKTENSDLQSILNDLKREKLDLLNVLNSKEKELENVILNLNALREACVVLEEQLIEYENVLDGMRVKQNSIENEKGKWLENLKKTQDEVKEAKKLGNEEKSLRLLAETKYKRLLNDFDVLQNENQDMKKRLESLKLELNVIDDLQEKLADLEVIVNSKERTINELFAENKSLKEISSERLTIIQNLKENNYDLKKKLEDCEEYNKQSLEEILELNEKIEFYKERELKSNATIQQQIKLIHYLQTKMEEFGNKKKSFAEKLFTHSKKENIAPLPQQQQQQKDLEMQLYREKEKNKMLRCEIENFKKQTFIDEKVCCEGWIRTFIGRQLQKKYAKLTETTIFLYNQQQNTIPIKSFIFLRNDCHCKFVMEVLPSEIDDYSNDYDIGLAIKLEIIPKTQCWPPETFYFLLEDIKEKERWGGVLQNLYSNTNFLQQTPGDLICILPGNVSNNTNCLIDLKNNETIIIGTNSGLYSYNTTTNNKIVCIEGPKQIYEICIIKKINQVLMIVDEKRFLIRCDLKHLENQAKCAPCSKPKLHFDKIDLKQLNGFHFLHTNGETRICIATTKQILIANYDLEMKEFVMERILDTAKPTSCALFTEHATLIVGADKFFEVHLDDNFVALEFLDLYKKMKFTPIGIFTINRHLEQYLCCFKEIALLVDDYGKCLREIKWNYLPLSIRFVSHSLFVTHFHGLEILKFTRNVNDGDDEEESMKISLQQPRLLGSNDKGVYLLLTSNGEIRFFDGNKQDDMTSTITDESDRFSFTSSVVQCLDNCSEAEGYTNTTKKVIFTDL